MYEVQSGPPPKRPFRSRKYPFEKLEIGEWFFVPNRLTKNLYSHVSNAGKKLRKLFSTRQVYMKQAEVGWEACAENDPNAVSGVCVRRLE